MKKTIQIADKLTLDAIKEKVENALTKLSDLQANVKSVLSSVTSLSTNVTKYFSGGGYTSVECKTLKADKASGNVYTSETVTITGCGEIQIVGTYIYQYQLYITKIDDATIQFTNGSRTDTCSLIRDDYMLQTIKFTKNISFYIRCSGANTVGGIQYIVKKY